MFFRIFLLIFNEPLKIPVGELASSEPYLKPHNERKMPSSKKKWWASSKKEKRKLGVAEAGWNLAARAVEEATNAKRTRGTRKKAAPQEVVEDDEVEPPINHVIPATTTDAEDNVSQQGRIMAVWHDTCQSQDLLQLQTTEERP